MTMYDVYACDWESAKKAIETGCEPFDWIKNVVTPFFPPTSTGVPSPYERVRTLLKERAAPGGTISQLEYAIFATKADLLRYLAEWYGPDGGTWFSKLRDSVLALDDDGEYALVADEF